MIARKLSPSTGEVVGASASEPDSALSPGIALMASDEVRRLLACDPTQNAPFCEDEKVFDRRRHAYLSARADIDDPGVLTDQRLADLAQAAFETAEALLFATPAALPHQVYAKLEILEAAITDDMKFRRNPSPRVTMALASFKVDLHRFELIDPERNRPLVV